MIVQYDSSFLISFVFNDPHDRRIARMTGKLEWPESQNDHNVRTTSFILRNPQIGSSVQEKLQIVASLIDLGDGGEGGGSEPHKAAGYM